MFRDGTMLVNEMHIVATAFLINNEFNRQQYESIAHSFTNIVEDLNYLIICQRNEITNHYQPIINLYHLSNYFENSGNM